MKEEIIKIIAGVAEVPEESINLKTNLIADLDLESLDLVTLVSEIENKYRLEIPDKEIKKIQTVEDIVNFLSSHVQVIYKRKCKRQRTFKREFKKDYNISDYEIIYNEYNKPYLKNEKIYFNISHSNGTIVLVISDKEIGVDVEYFVYKESVVRKYFTNNEQNEILNSTNKVYDFTRIWVMKEAFVKMKGIGISYGLINVDTTKIKEQIELIENEKYLIAICKSEEQK